MTSSETPTDTAAAPSGPFVLYAPDGREFVTTVLAEATRLRAQGYSDTPPTAVPVPDADPDDDGQRVTFDPADHTIDEVLAYIEAHPEQGDAVLAAEAAGKHRAGLLGS